MLWENLCENLWILVHSFQCITHIFTRIHLDSRNIFWARISARMDSWILAEFLALNMNTQAAIERPGNTPIKSLIYCIDTALIPKIDVIIDLFMNSPEFRVAHNKHDEVSDSAHVQRAGAQQLVESRAIYL